MPGWTLVSTDPIQGRIFQRPLDTIEKAIYLMRRLDGLGDILYHYEIHLANGSPDAHLFSETNIVKAWLSTKRRYPLAGAIMRGADGTPLQFKVPADSNADHGLGIGFSSEPHFVVQEHDLSSLRPGEVTFGNVASAEEARKQAVTTFIDGPRPISDDLQAQLHVLRETGAENLKPDVLHLMIQFGHHVTDGTSTRTFVRCLLDTLSRGGGAEPVQLPLEERLATAVPVMDVEPAHLRSLSPAVRRWRKAVGFVISQQRMAKKRGGHTLPCRRTHSTSFVSSPPGIASTSLTDTQTTTVLGNCHQHGITFASAYSVLAQVAMTRVLYRRYLRGEISEEEWAHRKRQPHNTGGHALNLRPYLDKAWFENGGGGEFMLSACFYFLHQPSMAFGGTCVEKHRQVMSDGAPPFSDLLTFDRFLHRARLVKKQVTAFTSHPLFTEIVYASYQMVLFYHMQLLALQCKRRSESKAANGHETAGELGTDGDKAPAVSDSMRPVMAHGGSSMGNLDLTFPTQYPIPPTHPLSPYSSIPHPRKAGYMQGGFDPPLDSEADATPKIVIQYWKEHIHVRSGDLSLGAATSGGQLSMYVHFDAAVFEDAVVTEWLDEVKGAVLWYLGQSEVTLLAK